MIRHARNAKHRGFPKGHPDEGETPLETALRECREEIGIQDFQIVKENMFEEHYSYRGKERAYRFVPDTQAPDAEISRCVGYFIGFVDTKEVQVRPQEVEDYAWLPLDKVQERLSFPDIKKLFGEIKATLLKLQAHAQD